MAKTKAAQVAKGKGGKAESKVAKQTKSEEPCSISGISKEWDQIPELRSRILDGKNVLDPTSTPAREDINECVINKELLTPLLQKMCVHPSRKVPQIDDLRDEVSDLLTLCKRSGPDLTSMVEETAKHLKKLVGFVKTKARRKEVSTATWLLMWHLFFSSSLLFASLTGSYLRKKLYKNSHEVRWKRY